MMICDTCGCSKEKLNYIFTVILYIPNGIILTAYFAMTNILVMPFAYLSHLFTLSTDLFKMENAEEGSDILIATFEFMFLGPFLLIASLIIDPVVFAYNLFTEP